jgi:hypothetical protein
VRIDANLGATAFDGRERQRQERWWWWGGASNVVIGSDWLVARACALLQEGEGGV